MGAHTQRYFDSFSGDRVHDRREAQRVRAQSDMIMFGSWHSHPRATPMPSEVDLETWAQERIEGGLSAYIGVIVTPDERRGWDEPQLHCWVLRASISDTFDIAERAQLLRR
jgi:proteasome lid subunit RPN8/RPN11